MFSYKPKAYYGVFSFLFTKKLYLLFLGYIFLIFLISISFASFYDLIYAGPTTNHIMNVTWFHKFYYSLTTFMSPGFTEFLPLNDSSRILTMINGIMGLLFNAFFLSVLVARILQPHKPFEIVPFLLYDSVSQQLTARFYSTLPDNCYNLKYRLFRFGTFTNHAGKEIGKTLEIEMSPGYRNVLLPNYGILLRAKVDLDNNAQNASFNNTYTRKKVPIEWLLPTHKKYVHGHFYLTIEAETSYGKMFQLVNFYPNKNDIKVGRHMLLNDDRKLTLENWYNWKEYRWDLWEKFSGIPENEFRDDMITRYYNE